MNFKEMRKGLEFVQACQSDIGNPYQTHCEITDEYVRATNGVFSMRYLLGEPETVRFCPHTLKLLNVLNVTDCNIDSFKIHSDTMELKSGAMRFKVPVLSDFNLIPDFQMDEEIAPITPKFTEAIKYIGAVASDTAQEVIAGSVYMDSGSITTSNKRLAVQEWHGVDSPTALIPIRAAKLLTDHDKPIRGFGVSGIAGNSITFYFEDDSCFMTTLFELSEWRNLNSAMDINGAGETVEVHPSIAEGYKKIASFCEGRLIIGPTEIRAVNSSASTSASYVIEGGPTEEMCFNDKDFALFLRYSDRVIFASDRVYFFKGDFTRGILMGMRVK